MIRPNEVHVHEAGHAVVAAYLAVPFTAVVSDGQEGVLDMSLKQLWSDRSAGQLVALAVVAAAGPLAHATGYSGRWIELAPSFASREDLKVIAAARNWYLTDHPHHAALWPRDVYVEAARILLVVPHMFAAMNTVATRLAVRGTLTAEAVRDTLAEHHVHPSPYPEPEPVGFGLGI